MNHENAVPKDRPSAINILATAIAAEAPQFDEKIDADSMNGSSRLDCHWKFRACVKASEKWPFQLDPGRKGWDSTFCIDDFLNRFEGLSRA